MTMKTREELAAMTDDEVLAHYRAKHGNPYMPLSMAKEARRQDFKWWHDTARWEKRAREGKLPAPEHCRYGDGTCLTHRRTWIVGRAR
ncbi:MAG TPA: hypothetical protein VES60_09640 [Nakamurella sp.]|nr:hypothetical protein [Nakamurella sp.]